MPEESTIPDLVELTRRSVDAGNARDWDAAMSCFAADAVWDGPVDSACGAAAIRANLEEYARLVGEARIEIDDAVDLGGGIVLLITTMSAHPHGSDSEMQQREAMVFKWSAGRIVKVITRTDIDEARIAAERLAESRGQAVSQENVEIVRSVVEAFFSEQPERALVSLHPEVEFASGFTERKTYRGPSGMWEYKADLEAVWVGWHPEDSRFVDVGDDRVVWLYRIVGRGKGSGVPVSQPVAIVWTLCDRLIWRGQGYHDHHAALKAVGLEG
jgi:ketosteroid isomerase-like protein